MRVVEKVEQAFHPALAHHGAKNARRRLRLTPAQRHEAILGHVYTRMCAETALYTMDGFLSEEQALRAAWGEQALIDELCTPVLGDGPMVHRRPDNVSKANCVRPRCLDRMGGWTRPDCLYLVCQFAKGTWTRVQQELHRAKKADTVDAALKVFVYNRDGGACRYCRSGPLPRKSGRPPKDGRPMDPRRKLTFDHVDPSKEATPVGAEYGSNLVTCCGACNPKKAGNRPEEVGMPVLAVPTDEEKAAWKARGWRGLDVVVNFDAVSAPVAEKVKVEKSAESTFKSPQKVLSEGLSAGTFAGVQDGTTGAPPQLEGLGEVCPANEKVTPDAPAEVSESAQVSPAAPPTFHFRHPDPGITTRHEPEPRTRQPPLTGEGAGPSCDPEAYPGNGP